MKKIIMKFGGTSVGTGENIRNVAHLVSGSVKEGYSVIVVTSAIGGTTDRLVEASETARKGDEEYVKEFKVQILDVHLAAVCESIKNERLRKEVTQTVKSIADELEKVLTGISYVGELTPKSRDYVLSFGERLAAPIICGALRDIKLDSKCFTGKEAGIVTDSNFGEANPLMNVTAHEIKEHLEPLLEKGVVPVVTGYIAANQDGIVTTLGRGGSDYTAMK